MTTGRMTMLALGAAALLAGRAHAFGGMDPSQFKAAADAAFTEADTDGSGGLTPAEFAQFHEILRTKIEALRFNQLDTNGDDVLTKDELEAGRPHRHGGPGF